MMLVLLRSDFVSLMLLMPVFPSSLRLWCGLVCWFHDLVYLMFVYYPSDSDENAFFQQSKVDTALIACGTRNTVSGNNMGASAV